jgi:inner membrane protein
MDSVTQAALGAAVGEAVLGRTTGYRAALWGAVIGTIPDLDIAAYPWLDEVSRLGWHRGFSHSLLFAVLAAPLLALVIHRIHRGSASLKQWTLLAFLVLFTHILLDCFTVYGTQVFSPFSHYMVAFDSISIIDPLYTLPLLAGIVIGLFFARSSDKRRWINYIGLGLSTVYLLVTVRSKLHVESVAEASLQRHGINYTRLMVTPTLFNSVLWRITAETEQGYRIGYYSLLDSAHPVAFRFVPRNDSLIAAYKDTEPIRQLLWFSDGYYAITKKHDKLLFHDLRFGEIHTKSFRAPGVYVFSWKLNISHPDGRPHVTLSRAGSELEDASGAFALLMDRIRGAL